MISTPNRLFGVFDDFVESNTRNEWLMIGKLEIYCRNSQRLDDDKQLVPMLDIANVYLPKNLRGHKVFTQFLSYVECKTSKPIFIENVDNSDLHAFFCNREGYRCDGINFIKDKKK